MEYTSIKYSVSESVAKIILHRPDKFNSFNRAMALEIQDALDKSALDKNVRALLISGEGKAFCAGQDLGEEMEPDGAGIRKAVREHYNPIIKKIREIEKPVICAVNGVAAGAGANVALACDIVIAGTSASFIQAFSKIGLIPDSGGTYFLPRLIGFQRASALMMLGDKVSAAEALQMGMIYKVTDDTKLADEATMLAKTLAQMPTKGIGLTKRLLNASLFNSLGQQLNLEEEVQAEAGQTFDFKEGVKAFLEKGSRSLKENNFFQLYSKTKAPPSRRKGF